MPAEKVLESRSRAIFSEAASPWLVTDWTQHDYGIDAIVEVTRARPSGHCDATGKRFALQLKATAEEASESPVASVRVRPEHIRYWVESTEPVLLVLCHVPSRTLLWRWVDYSVVDELNRRDPAWIGQKTVTVNIPTGQKFDEASRSSIAKYVTDFHPSARRVLAPGTYMECHTRLTALSASLSTLAREAGFESVIRRLADLEVSVRRSTYVVALTGPARAGKSTLLNALVGREVSPVGRLPTTAVSLLVTAGSKEEAEVVLADDARVRGEPSAEFLRQFATQEENPDNDKGVRMVLVRLVSALLERGVAYADAPGLYDPSESIRAVTEKALSAAHAVLYVLDVSPARDGGFSLTHHHLEDLKRLSAVAERLFVVLNKAEVLSEDDRTEVRAYVRQTLEKYRLLDTLPAPPIFASASAGWKWQSGGRMGASPLSQLEEAIWAHLLQTNSTGLDRLRGVASELRRGGEEFASLLAARCLSGAEAFRLREALTQCRSTERDLVDRCRRQRPLDEQMVSGRLSEHRDALLSHLRGSLESWPLDRDLPNADQIEHMLQEYMLKALADVWRELNARVELFAATVSRDVEASLRQARLAAGTGEPMSFQRPQVPSLGLDADSFEEAWTGLFTGGLFGLILGGPWTWVLALGGLVAGAFLGRERRRKREITRIVEGARTSLGAASGSVITQASENIRVYLSSLERHVTDRISVFVHDVETQLERLGDPVTPDEARRLKEREQSVHATVAALADVWSRLAADERRAELPPSA